MRTVQSVRSPKTSVSSRVGVLCSETGAGGVLVLNETMKGCFVMRSVFRSVLVALVAVVAVGVAGVASASAQPVFEGCVQVPAGTGGYESAACSGAVGAGTHAFATMSSARALSVCLFAGAGAGEFESPQCVGGAGTSPSYDAFTGTSAFRAKMTGSKFKWKLKIAGVSMPIECKKDAAKGAKIVGGTPGAMEAEALEFTECVSVSPTKCVVNSPGQPAGTIDTSAVSSELVENTSKTKIEDLLFPSAGGRLTTIEYKNKGTESCVFKNYAFPIEGETLTEVSPENALTGTVTLTSEPSSKEYLNGKGEARTAELATGGEPVTVSGSFAVEATSEKVAVSGKEGKKGEVKEGSMEFGVF